MNEKKLSVLSPGRIVFWAAAAVLFLALFSSCTTPLLRVTAGYDSSFFILVGQGMKHGLLPYRDYFDMKGPYLFWIENLGQVIAEGRIGAFIIQCLSLFISLMLADRMLRPMLPRGWKGLLCGFCLLLPFFAAAAITFEGGNLTEEYSLPLLLGALLCCVQYKENCDLARSVLPHSWKTGLYYGIAFGILALIRVTNAAVIGAVILTIAVFLLKNGQWKNLLTNGAAFIAGTVLAFVPACIWAAYNGILIEMLRQVFAFGFAYSDEISMAEKFVRLVKTCWPCFCIGMLPVLVLALCRVKDGFLWLLSVLMWGLVIIAAAMGNAYFHYFTLALPSAVLAAWLAVRFRERWKPLRSLQGAAVGVVLLLVCVFAVMQKDVRYTVYDRLSDLFFIVTGNEDTAEYDAVKDIVSMIPEEERNSVYAYGVSSCSRWYLQAGLQPANRYCDWQERYIKLVPEIGEELAEWLAGGGAEWLVIPNGTEIGPEEIADAVSANYTVCAQNADYILLQADKD